jgi:calcium binding protein 39
MSSDNNTNKPFEWLSGGLFFGHNKKDGIETVDSEKDVNSLLNGISSNLDKDLLEQQELSSSTTTPPVTQESTTKQPPEDSNTNKVPSQSDFLAARLARLRFLLYDERRLTSSQQDNNSNIFQIGGNNITTPTVALTTVQGLASTDLQDLMPKLIENLHSLPFESRKHVAAIFNYLLVCGFEGNDREIYIPIMNMYRNYVETNFVDVIKPIVDGYGCGSDGCTDVILHCGSMYRSCFRHSTLYRRLVCTTDRVEQYIFPFFSYALLPNFDVSSDAMENIKLIMTAGNENISSLVIDETTQRELAELSAAFLIRDYEAVWDQRFNPKLLSPDANYMTKRVALQILSTVLLTRSNYAVMIRYVNSRNNLILVMKLLRDTSPHITLDAFHVFKVFVANPSKIPDVEKILRDNSQKLCSYLETLHQDKEASDQQFSDEKKLIIATIRSL